MKWLWIAVAVLNVFCAFCYYMAWRDDHHLVHSIGAGMFVLAALFNLGTAYVYAKTDA